MTGCLYYDPLLNLILEVQFNTYIEVGVNSAIHKAAGLTVPISRE